MDSKAGGRFGGFERTACESGETSGKSERIQELCTALGSEAAPEIAQGEERADEGKSVTIQAGASVAQAPADAAAQPLRLRGGSFTLIVLQLIDFRAPTAFRDLLDKIGQAPDFFKYAPVVLDLDGLADMRPFNFAELSRRFRQHKLIPVGVQNGTEAQNQAAINAGLSVLPRGRAAALAAEKPAAQGPAAAAKAEGGPAKLVTEPVRSGRQIYQHDGDLIAMATVSAGAEILADGHIHVYGRLLGRALAGVSGDTNARIFCRSFDAELVSIAGHWRVREDIDERLIGRPVQIYLDGERLVIETLAEPQSSTISLRGAAGA